MSHLSGPVRSGPPTSRGRPAFATTDSRPAPSRSRWHRKPPSQHSSEKVFPCLKVKGLAVTRALSRPVKSARALQHGKVQDCELPLFSGPFSAKRESGGGGHSCELVDRVFVRVLRADRFARLKLDGFAAQRDRLRLAADQVHFHSTQLRVVAGLMEKPVQIKVRAQLAIDVAQEIEIEFGRHA